MAIWGPTLAFGAALVAALGLTWARGGPTERLGAVLLLVGWCASLLARQVAARPDPAAALLMIDLAVLAGLGSLAWKSERDWPAWAAGFQAVGAATDLAALTQSGLPARIHLTALGLTGCGVLAALLTGTLRGACERRRTPERAGESVN